MKKNIVLIGLIILFAALLGVQFWIASNSESRIDAIHKENEKLELRCDSLNSINDSMKIEMDNYSKKIDSMKSIDKKLSADYIENQNQIKNIKKKYEKNNRIDNFSTPDIIKYFTDF